LRVACRGVVARNCGAELWRGMVARDDGAGWWRAMAARDGGARWRRRIVARNGGARWRRGVVARGGGDGASIQQSQRPCSDGGLRAVMYIQFAVNMFDMLFHGANGDEEAGSDLLIGTAFREQAQDC